MPRLRTSLLRTDKERRVANAFRMQKTRRSYFSTGSRSQTYVGRCFNEITTFNRHVFVDVHICSYCDTRLFSTETQGTCCGFGKIRQVIKCY
jgi:hypothetical protein